jgi:hypothetical protein
VIVGRSEGSVARERRLDRRPAGVLARAVTGDAEARQWLLQLTHDSRMRHARRFLQGRNASLEPLGAWTRGHSSLLPSCGPPR